MAGWTYTNSDSGNRTEWAKVGGTTHYYEYDSTDRMVENKRGGVTYATFGHNAAGQRVWKTTGGATTLHFNYDLSGQLIAEQTPAGGLAKEYIHLNGMVLGFVSGGTLHWMHQDHIGRPRMVASRNGDAQWKTSWQPFGRILAGKTSGTVPTELRFPGQYWDWEGGFAYNGFRDYDYTSGRYAQSDPIGLAGGWNTYAYVSGNPVMRVDPSGLDDPGPGNLDLSFKGPVDPYSDKHIRRNEKNKCPGSPPKKDCDEDKYYDHIGVVWERDSPTGEKLFHGGGLGYKTWRQIAMGWQCTYNGEILITEGPYQGTYDYYSPNEWYNHYLYDIFPHRVNPNYVDNLTTVY